MTENVFADTSLDPRLIKALASMEISAPTEVQASVIPPALNGENLRISAQTGSGKTLAYLLPIAQSMLLTPPSRSEAMMALVLVPTRELARQVTKVARALLKFTSLQADAITGGADFKYQRAMLRKNPEIVVATPGRILEHCQRRSTDLADLRTLVLDEADRMLELGFREDVLELAALSDQRPQTLMLSATLGYRGLGALGRAVMSDAKTLETTPQRKVHEDIFHQRILADSPEHKYKLLLALLSTGENRRCLVFANKRRTADRLAGLLAHHRIKCSALHGELSTEERKAVVARFADNKLQALCASDVAARGLDVPGIDLVINYDVPHSGDDYVHRTGRTGRAGASGLAISLVDANEWNLMASIQRYLKTEFELRALPGLKARYSGPKKLKSSGKAASKGKKKSAAPRKKVRQRDRKNVGKPVRVGNTHNDGFAPLTKKPSGKDKD